MENNTAQAPVKKDRSRLYGLIIRIAAIAVIVISVFYGVLTFLSHGAEDGRNAYRMNWMRELTAGGGLYSDTIPMGSLEAIQAAIDFGNYNVKLDVKLENETVVLDYENSYPLRDALELTLKNNCGVILEIKEGGEKTAEAICALLEEMKYDNGHLAIQSEDTKAIEWLKDNRPLVIRGLVTGDLKETDLNGFEKFLHRNMLLNYTCRPFYVVFDADCLPTLASDSIRKQIYVLSGKTSDIKDIEALNESVDGFILEGYTFVE